ncbi:heme ABC transporter ATP-binding protein [Paludifilum halophilum]|uniref:Heme ABC transporter ATP-binding protein n=1 Tax=Paludifilum halophilum TaxID=1642702 RepID=A0A235B6Q9_9BACL|nr:heme ABC transporter ATP-binding protein [Paludifilum halophilum]
MIVLTAEGITQSYGGTVVLRGIDLEVNPGETVGLIGPNGSGKTTLVRLLSGEETPDAGSVKLKGRELSAWSPRERARRVAVLPQEGLPPVAFTVEEVVTMGRHPHQGPWPWTGREDRKVVDQVLSQTSLERERHQSVDRMSGGERQRVAIAKAMAQQPELLILDEPTTFLDISHQLAILDRIRSWQRKEGLAVLVVLHDLNLAAQYCDRLLMIQNGALVREGTPADVIQSSAIREVYGVEPVIIPHPLTRIPQVLLRPESVDRRSRLSKESVSFSADSRYTFG